MEKSVLLNLIQTAEFTAKGCIRFDSLIDDSLDRGFLDLFPAEIGSNDKHVNKLIPNCRPGEFLPNAFPINYLISKILDNPVVAGTLKSPDGN